MAMDKAKTPTGLLAVFAMVGFLSAFLAARFYLPDQMPSGDGMQTLGPLFMALFWLAHVSLRGGGLLMLGGQESFASGGYDRTPIGEMLPVYLDRFPQAPNPGCGWSPRKRPSDNGSTRHPPSRAINGSPSKWKFAVVMLFGTKSTARFASSTPNRNTTLVMVMPKN